MEPLKPQKSIRSQELIQSEIWYENSGIILWKVIGVWLGLVFLPKTLALRLRKYILGKPCPELPWTTQMKISFLSVKSGTWMCLKYQKKQYFCRNFSLMLCLKCKWHVGYFLLTFWESGSRWAALTHGAFPARVAIPWFDLVGFFRVSSLSFTPVWLFWFVHPVPFSCVTSSYINTGWLRKQQQLLGKKHHFSL